MRRAHLNATRQRLKDLNPQTILERGYAIVSLADGQSVRSVEQVNAGDALNVNVSDGEFAVEVTNSWSFSVFVIHSLWTKNIKI